MSQALRDLLRSLSDVLFPSAPDTPVQINSVGYDGDTPLHVVTWRNDLEAVQLLLAAGADPNGKGEMDETPLHIAVHHGNEAMVRAMLRFGARADIRCELGDTAAERASQRGGEIAALIASVTPPNTSFERTREG